MTVRSLLLVRVVVVISLAALAACSSGPSRGLQAGEGFIPVDGGRVWYRIVGSGTATPLLVLHGGPGVPSQYLWTLSSLADERPVIFYDQLGCGRSDHPDDNSLWTIEHFVAELATVRKALNLGEVHLYGHSWGTILAAEYLFTKPEGVRSVTLASPALSIPRWEEDTRMLLLTIPDSAQSVIAAAEASGEFDTPEYQGAMMEFYARYVARRQPWSDDLNATFADLQNNPTVYMYMEGPSEFTITGTLKGYDCTARLHEITLPTLFTCGRYDELPVSTAQYYQGLIGGAQLAVIEDSGHLTSQDAPEENARVIREFLRAVERK